MARRKDPRSRDREYLIGHGGTRRRVYNIGRGRYKRLGVAASYPFTYTHDWEDKLARIFAQGLGYARQSTGHDIKSAAYVVAGYRYIDGVWRKAPPAALVKEEFAPRTPEAVLGEMINRFRDGDSPLFVNRRQVDSLDRRMREVPGSLTVKDNPYAKPFSSTSITFYFRTGYGESEIRAPVSRPSKPPSKSELIRAAFRARAKNHTLNSGDVTAIVEQFHIPRPSARRLMAESKRRGSK